MAAPSVSPNSRPQGGKCEALSDILDTMRPTYALICDVYIITYETQDQLHTQIRLLNEALLL